MKSPQSQEPSKDNTVEVSLSYKDINLIYKYLSRANLSGAEVPEFNYIIQLFEKDLNKGKTLNLG